MKTLVLPGNISVEASADSTYEEILKQHLPGPLGQAMAIRVNDQIIDLKRPVEFGGEVQLVNFSASEGKEVFWHSSAHVLAQAIKRLYPSAQLTFGPVIESGHGFFYYDIFLEEKKITEADFEAIEAEMAKIVSEALPVERLVYDRNQAIDEFRKMGEEFKARIIADIPEDHTITVYRQGEFQDLCRGPHVPNTSRLGFFKLTAVSGAYWKGDPANPVLQRIYGVSFPTNKELKAWVARIEEAKKRDHRKLGRELDLFSFHEEGPGFPFYHARGTILFNTLAQYIREECTRRGYDEIRTPTVLSDELWMRSGHYQNFKENMYFTSVDDKGYAIKPMNCPGSNLVYKTSPRSYRDLPLRMAELGTVHRHELHGVLHGLFRVRAFTQDDAHIYCTPEQLQDEILAAIDFTISVYQKFGFEQLNIFVATRPEKYLGSDEVWEKATTALVNSLESLNLPYKIKAGEGAFYGPKIEFNIQDSMERNWQLGTIQVDFSMPERLDLEYMGADGKKYRPVMVHRAILGSLERFMGILLEHFAGKMPLWLSPTQIKILTVHESQDDYAREIDNRLRHEGFRSEIDLRNEKIGYKIREWNNLKINYALVVGANEMNSNSVTVRRLGDQNSESMALVDFIAHIKNERQNS